MEKKPRGYYYNVNKEGVNAWHSVELTDKQADELSKFIASKMEQYDMIFEEIDAVYFVEDFIKEHNISVTRPPKNIVQEFFDELPSSRKYF